MKQRLATSAFLFRGLLWRDYAHRGKQKAITISAHEFLRCFLSFERDTNTTDRPIAFGVPNGHWLPWITTALLEQMLSFQHRPEFESRLSACSSEAFRIERGLDCR